MDVILIAVIVLGAIGLIAALVLFLLSKKFAVKEDPRLGEVTEALPGANCGGCGFPGCGGLAAACVKAADAGSLEGLNCPVGGQPTMEKIAAILGMKVEATAPKLAIVRCNGSCENRPRINEFDGVRSCKVMNSASMGETGCAYGCLGCGDCVEKCQFDAIKMNPETGLPEVDSSKCTACGACAKTCPRHIIEIREVKGTKEMGVVVRCMNKDKGAVAMKSCKAACIGCQKCVKVCQFDAVHVENFLAYIDPAKCRNCRKCEQECPKNVIVGINMPVLKAKPAAGTVKQAVVTPKAVTTTANVSTPAPKAAIKVEPFKAKPGLMPLCQQLILSPAALASPERPSQPSVSSKLSTTDLIKSANDLMPVCQQLILKKAES